MKWPRLHCRSAVPDHSICKSIGLYRTVIILLFMAFKVRLSLSRLYMKATSDELEDHAITSSFNVREVNSATGSLCVRNYIKIR